MRNGTRKILWMLSTVMLVVACSPLLAMAAEEGEEYVPEMFATPWSLLPPLVAIVLAIDGRIDPVLGALVHNAGSVFVMICSAFLLKWKAREQL